MVIEEVEEWGESQERVSGDITDGLGEAILKVAGFALSEILVEIAYSRIVGKSHGTGRAGTLYNDAFDRSLFMILILLLAECAQDVSHNFRRQNQSTFGSLVPRHNT